MPLDLAKLARANYRERTRTTSFRLSLEAYARLSRMAKAACCSRAEFLVLLIHTAWAEVRQQVPNDTHNDTHHDT